VLTGMDEYDECSSLDELDIEGSLLDDIGFGRDHDDMDMFFWSSREVFPESFADMDSIICYYLIHMREYKGKEIFGKKFDFSPLLYILPF
jgi:hypothetical protein